MAKPGKKGQKFERKLADLEKIVARLEEGETSLEDSLSLFQKGTNYLKELADMLDEAERQVEVLTEDSSGGVTTRPLDEEPGQG